MALSLKTLLLIRWFPSLASSSQQQQQKISHARLFVAYLKTPSVLVLLAMPLFHGNWCFVVFPNWPECPLAVSPIPRIFLAVPRVLSLLSPTLSLFHPTVQLTRRHSFVFGVYLQILILDKRNTRRQCIRDFFNYSVFPFS